MKKSVKIAVIVIISLAAVLTAAYFVLSSCVQRLADSGEFSRADELMFVPNTESQMSAYIAAGIEYENGNYDAAYGIFYALGDYRLSEDYAHESLYLYAKQLADEYEFDAACGLYAKLADIEYKDSKAKVTETRIAKGSYLCQTKRYSDAAELFYALADEGCEGADDMVKDTLCKWARSLINSKDYITAYSKICDAGDYPGTDDLHKEIISLMYDEGVLEYRRGHYEEAQEYFEILPTDYGDSDKYRMLINVHTAEDGYSSYYDEIVEMLGFEDTADMLMSDSYIAITFLKGRWYDDDGYIKLDCSMHGFRCYIKNRQAGRSYITIQNGYVYAYNMNESGEMVDVVKDLRLTIIDHDTLSVHSYANGKDVVIRRKAL